MKTTAFILFAGALLAASGSFAQAKTEFDAVRGQCARGYNGASVDRQPGVPSPQSAELLHAK